jgi:hypothetical protein
LIAVLWLLYLLLELLLLSLISEQLGVAQYVQRFSLLLLFGQFPL